MQEKNAIKMKKNKKNSRDSVLIGLGNYGDFVKFDCLNMEKWIFLLMQSSGIFQFRGYITAGKR